MITDNIKNELREKCDFFVNRVVDCVNFYNMYPIYSDFPIFEIANSEFYEYIFYQKLIESELRDEVINPIIGYLFFEKGINIEIPKRDKVYIRFSTEKIEKIYPFEFRIKQGKSYIGVRYIGISENDDNFNDILKEHRIKQVIVVRWEENIKYKQESKIIKEQTARDFLDSYFGEEIADFVLTEIKAAVRKAKVEVGIQTISMLSLKNLSSFKSERILYFSKIEYSQMSYQSTEKTYIEKQKDYLLSNEDAKILNDYFVKGEFYRVFDGQKKFSKCFMTSEYLYSIFKLGNSFDYTTVISGYLKSVEQLIYEIVLSELYLRPSDNVLMKRKTGKLKNFDYVKSISVKNPKTQAWMVPFLPKNEKYFDISLSPLIWLLHDHDSIWRISDDGKEKVHNILLKYSQEYRNDYFHKDNIYKFEYVEEIRNNTILIFYLLIGGCKLSNDSSKNDEILGIDREEFTELCKKLYQIPRSANIYAFKYGEDEVKVIRLYDQQRPLFDENGTLKNTVIEFAKVDDGSRIILSKDELPDEISMIIRDGERKEIFKKTVL